MVHGLETIAKLNNEQASAEQRPEPKELFGVFFMSSYMDIEGIEDRSIHIFSTLDDAEKFVVDGLVAAGLMKEINGRWIPTDGSAETYFTKEEAIRDTQDVFHGMEFFHIYKATDHR